MRKDIDENERTTFVSLDHHLERPNHNFSAGPQLSWGLMPETASNSWKSKKNNSSLLRQPDPSRKGSGSPAGFADCLIERSRHAAEYNYTLTFNQNAATGSGMRLLRRGPFSLAR
jgi:hypothetical protein